jgi:hypothetical protein
MVEPAGRRHTRAERGLNPIHQPFEPLPLAPKLLQRHGEPA